MCPTSDEGRSIRHRHLEMGLSQRFLGGNQTILRLQQVNLRRVPSLVLRANQVESFQGQGNRVLGRPLGLAFRFKKPAAVGHVVANGIAQDHGKGGGLLGLGIGQMALGIPDPTIVEHPIELQTNRPAHVVVPRNCRS